MKINDVEPTYIDDNEIVYEIEISLEDDFISEVVHMVITTNDGTQYKFKHFKNAIANLNKRNSFDVVAAFERLTD